MFFLQKPNSRVARRAAAVWSLLLFLGGILAWGTFFSWGHLNLNFHDWASITAPRLQFLKDAATRLELPLHVSDPRTLDYVTDRYLSVPDAFLAPQAILLRWMDLGSFVLVDVVLLYTLGFWGLLRLARRFGLSPAAFGLLFLLFNFNGHVVAHYAVGHFTWGGYFLLPFFVELLHDLLRGRADWAWAAKLAGLTLAIYLQGSFHQFVWILLLLTFTTLLVPGCCRAGLRGLMAVVGTSLFRILPPILLLGRFDNKFIAGYPNLATIWQALVQVAVPGDVTISAGLTNPVGWWELTLYVGVGGALFLLGFAGWAWLRDPHPAFDHRLVLPLLALGLLSMDAIYPLVQQLPIPIFAAERVATRMDSLALVVLLVIAAVQLQKWLDSAPRPTWAAGIAGAVLLFVGQDLWQNLGLWQVNRIADQFQASPFVAANWFVYNNYGDGGYFKLATLGAAASLGCLLALVALAWREKRQRLKSDRLPL